MPIADFLFLNTAHDLMNSISGREVSVTCQILYGLRGVVG